MPHALTSRARVILATETSFGVLPEYPIFTPLRLISESLTHSKQTVPSSAMTDDRTRPDLFETGVRAGGRLDFELAAGEFNTLIAAALQNTGVNTQISGISMTFTGGSGVVTLVAPNLLNNLAVGQYVRIAGAPNAANNGVFKVLARTSTVLTVEATFAAETTSLASIYSSRVVNGSTLSSFAIEKQFQDLSQHMLVRGLMVDALSLNLGARGVVRGSVVLNGKNATLSSTSAVADPENILPTATTKPFVAGINVASVTEGGTSLATAAQSLSLTVANNLRDHLTVDQKTPSSIVSGGLDVTGNLTVYFNSASLFNKFLNHTSTSLSFVLKDTQNYFVAVTLPKVYFTTGNPIAEGPDQDVIVPLDFTAVKDPVSGNVIQIDMV